MENRYGTWEWRFHAKVLEVGTISNSHLPRMWLAADKSLGNGLGLHKVACLWASNIYYKAWYETEVIPIELWDLVNDSLCYFSFPFFPLFFEKVIHTTDTKI